jgi:Protein of unknown function (DUF2370)
MSRYERVPSVLSPVADSWQVSANDDREHLRGNVDDEAPSSPSAHVNTPSSSRPPSFSSIDPLDESNERYELAASFQPDDDDDEADAANEQTRLRSRHSTDSLDLSPSHSSAHLSSNAPSLLPVPSPFGRDETTTSAEYAPRSGTDGVFANLEAKPDPNSPDGKYDEPLPSYEAAAADAAPPYWETTIITPGIDNDEVYVDGLPVGTFFAFIWNAMISMSFQFVGFLLTYLLASSHAARNGSRAGLGVILIQYGFYLRDTPAVQIPDQLPDPDTPEIPNAGPMPNDEMPSDHLPKAEWMSYLLMVIGWFILIRSVGEYYRVKQLEKAVRATPGVMGAAPAVVAEGEGEAAV